MANRFSQILRYGAALTASGSLFAIPFFSRGRNDPPKYTLYFFPLRGRGELIRLIFAKTGIPYEDRRIKWDDNWKKLRPEMPFFQMPVLEIDGVKYSQSHAIARYLANKYGLYGETELERLEIDMIADVIKDLQAAILRYKNEPNESRKDNLEKEFLTEKLPLTIGRLEQHIKPSGFFVGRTMSWADLAFLDLCSWIDMIGQDDLLVKHNKLHKLRKTIEKDPAIAKWLEQRPKTNF